MKQKRAYQYRCYPTTEQQRVLARTFGCVRFVYNWALRKKTDAYSHQGERLSYAHLSSCLWRGGQTWTGENPHGRVSTKQESQLAIVWNPPL